ncbi:SDR family oxidoreductase, partial [Vibrio cholerae]
KLFNDAVAARAWIAINTVGKVLKKPMAEITEAEYDEMMAVNSKTAFFFIKEAGKHLNDNGKICTIVTSLLGAFTPFYAAYAGSKAPV